ncbi:MAG: hypothetical protein ACOC1F_12780, partial [Myxococcota bacterium]
MTPFERGKEALESLRDQVEPKDPFAASLTRALLDLGCPADPSELFAFWSTRSIGSPAGEMRYRWELTHRRIGDVPAYADPASWRAWRSAEARLLERDPFVFESRLAIPIVLSDTTELLAAEATRGSCSARDLLREAAPALRRDFALHVQAIHPWSDTFALWCLSRRPLALAQLHPLAVAIATCHAADVEPGMDAVHGKRFPFHRHPFVSASAQLATGLMGLGLELDKVGRLAAFVADRQHPSGGWGDVEAQTDVLT